MIQQYNEFENNGIDPGLGDLAYDGTEYELDEFGERIGGDNLADDYADDTPIDPAAQEEVSMTDAGKIEHGFGETINPDSNPHIDDQLQDESLNQQAEADYRRARPEMTTSVEKDEQLRDS